MYNLIEKLKFKIEKLLRRGELKLKIIIISILIVTSTSCVKKDDDYSNQNPDVPQSDTHTLSSNKSINYLEVDPTILRTDSIGNIWGVIEVIGTLISIVIIYF